MFTVDTRIGDATSIEDNKFTLSFRMSEGVSDVCLR